MAKKKNKRDEFLSLIPSGAKKVLDLGCGSGNLGAKLRNRGIEVVGIEKDKNLYILAQDCLDKVFLADVEKFQLSYPKGYFDCLLCADILEHLKYPGAILKKYKDYLNNHGYVIASIPNIRYYKVIIRLVIGGRWDYADAGILDRSHLRFFTLANIRELFAQAGYEIVEIKRNIITAGGFKLLNFLCFNKLREFFVYQYYIKARKSKNGSLSFLSKRDKTSLYIVKI